ncbi:hypothetical protein BH09VER1_BH09VER1_51140 [soil metagenome]
MGTIGWRRKFDPRQAEAVRVVDSRSGEDATKPFIELSFLGDKRSMKFGGMLWGDRQKFVAGALSRVIRGGQGSLSERR